MAKNGKPVSEAEASRRKADSERDRARYLQSFSASAGTLGDDRRRLAPKEIAVLVIGTALALAGVASGDTTVVLCMLGLSWIAFMYLCVAHTGRILGRTIIATVITSVLSLIGLRAVQPPRSNTSISPAGAQQSDTRDTNVDEIAKRLMRDFDIRPKNPVGLTDLSQFLAPASDPDPLPDCKTDSGQVRLILGTNAWRSKNGLGGLLLGESDYIRYVKVQDQDRVAIDAEIRSHDKRLVAKIQHNQFTVNPENYFAMSRPDRSTLIVAGQDPDDYLVVRYIRPDTVKLSGSIHLASGDVFQIGENGFTIRNFPFFHMNHDCFSDSGFFAINTPPSRHE